MAGQTPPNSFVQAERQIVNGDYAGAIQLFTQSVAEDHTYAITYLERARCYIELNDTQRAFHDMQRYFALQPNSRDTAAYTRMGYCLIMQGQFKESAEMYTRAIELCPKYANSYLDRARCYEKLGMHKEAEKDLASFQSLNSGIDTTTRFRSQSAALVLEAARSGNSQILKQTPANERTISEGLKLMSTHTDTYNQSLNSNQANAVLSATLSMMETVKAQTKLIEEHKNNGEPYLVRAEAYLALRKYKEALADFDSVIAGASQPVPLFTSASAESASYGKASLLQTIGRHADAVEIYNEIIRKDAESTEAWYGKGVCLNRLGKYEAAIEALNRSIELNAEKPQAYETRAQAELSLGMLDAAAKDVQEAQKRRQEK